MFPMTSTAQADPFANLYLNVVLLLISNFVWCNPAFVSIYSMIICSYSTTIKKSLMVPMTSTDP